MSRRWIAIAVMATCALSSASAVAACSATSGTTRVPIVELYTAEGCDQCPPADRWLGALAASEDVNAMAFHVDYWNDAGWVDPFSDAAYTRRQEYRVRLAGTSTLFTPQVMVGRRHAVDWKSDPAFRRAVADAREGAPAVRLGLSGQVDAATGTARLKLDATPAARITEPAMLWIAVYRDAVEHRVTGGENRGLTLHHSHVVQQLAGPWKLDANGAHGSVVVPLRGVGSASLTAVLFAESGRDGTTLQSVALPLARCQ
ncbi:DUF1223 domain-containing protein [Lysobacter sp. TY2-98]|uniref:DUF1223 domain-containing protein n=1 Tax=Lysobacter sp. TY2-98 TaxID=2290922 RepID=UPI000E1FE201|nr:DUF1223 domain-containing protein [Lysobacter sp. TY2-98]AXK72918.1 DUF1223 domain-containing protein [Lysobacter sp. TY2-98]